MLTYVPFRWRYRRFIIIFKFLKIVSYCRFYSKFYSVEVCYNLLLDLVKTTKTIR